MRMRRLATLGVGAMVFIATAAMGQAGGPPGDGGIDRHRHLGDFLSTHAGTAIHETETGRITKVYGRAFSHGPTAQASAEVFKTQHAAIWGVDPADLAPMGPFDDRHHVQPIMYDAATGEYKFTGFYYTQMHQGIEVFRSRLSLTVRNEADYPLVLATADLRELGDFQAPAQAVVIDERALAAKAAQLIGPGAAVANARVVIWAGVEDQIVQPRVAISFIAENSGPAGYFKILYVVDANTLDVLFEENQVLDFTDVQGSISGMATEDPGADECEPETLRALPYARASIGGTVVFADADGDFTIPNGGSAPVTVNAELRGTWFNVNNQAGADTVLSMVVTPGVETADFVFNAANSSELLRAEVNAYLHANIVRDFTLSFNPAYPTIANQQDWPVNVNLSQNCNAFYNGSSINFYDSGGGCNNTAFSVVVHHEYGHHLVAVGGSGQGAYGEGMGDVMGVLITQTSQLAVGFNTGNCVTGIRDANNNCQYQTPGCSSCGSQIHACGQLISGCVWDTLQELSIVHGAGARDILANLAVNSILLHSGTIIDSSITIDYLTLDDDDSDITNGTPNYQAIANGFGAHNMPAPPLHLIGFEFPNGLPDQISQSGDVVRVEVFGIAETPEPGTGMVFTSVGGGPFTGEAMTEISPNVYDATLPPADCGSTIRYYFVAETTNGQAQIFPASAPAISLTAIVATQIEEIFADNFQTDQGWTVSGDALDGHWERGVPAGGGDRGDPPTDADGSGACYVTDNADGNSDVDDGSTILTSPAMNASRGTPFIQYWTWYDNSFGALPGQDIMVVEVSDDNGASWQTLEVIGPNDGQSSGGWFFKEFNLGELPGFDMTDQFRIRFTASDLPGQGSVVEAGVDGVTLSSATCVDPCPADVTGDGFVDVSDLLELLGAFGPCGTSCPLDFDDSGAVDVGDLLIMLAAWGEC